MDTISDRKHDSGTAYGRKVQSHDPILTEVGPGTPCGEFMRRYWHPVAVAENVTTRPQKVRILGEDLILFRDRKGRPGLLYPRCMHRGTTLFYGKVEDEGIRCCYHGWLFGVDGTCLDQPCEPEHGCTAMSRASPGIRSRNGTGWSGPIWGRRRKSRCSPAGTCSRMSGRRKRSGRAALRPARAATTRSRSCPATGCRIGRTSWTRSMSRFSTPVSAARNSCPSSASCRR